jgi:hypothetical protein
MINVHKVENLLKRAESVGKTPAGEICQVEIRRIEDGYYTLAGIGEGNEILVGLDIEAYGKIQSQFTKHSVKISQEGMDGSEGLVMKEEYATKHLMVQVEEDEGGCFSSKHQQLTCYLPLK